MFIGPSSIKQSKRDDLQLVGQQSAIKSPKGHSFELIAERISAAESGQKHVEHVGESNTKESVHNVTGYTETWEGIHDNIRQSQADM